MEIFLNLILKRIANSSRFKLLGRLFQVLALVQDTLWILGFVFRKLYSFIGRTRNYTIFTNRTEKFIKIVKTLIALKFKDIEDNELQHGFRIITPLFQVSILKV